MTEDYKHFEIRYEKSPKFADAYFFSVYQGNEYKMGIKGPVSFDKGMDSCKYFIDRTIEKENKPKEMKKLEKVNEEFFAGINESSKEDLEGYGDYKIGDHKESINQHLEALDRVRTKEEKEHHKKYINVHKELISRKTPDFKDAPHHQENMKHYFNDLDAKIKNH